MESIADEEILYRSVINNPQNYKIIDGTIRVSSSVFSDRTRKISVNRGCLQDNNASRTQLRSDDGVLSLITSDVRLIRVIKSPEAIYTIDVIADPIDNNIAHALIISHPDFDNDSRFRKLKESLALIANW